MIGTFDFDKIEYSRPRQFDEEEINKIVGVDTEAYTTGVPFLVCTSTAGVYTPADFPDFLFESEYEDTHFVCFNLKYDSGALLHTLPPEFKKELWEENKAYSNEGDLYEYIPHKFLSVKRGKTVACIWDIAQYFEGSLDRAAQKYLGARKLEIETKSFTPAYVKKHWKELVKYCIRDADLTARLAVFLKSKLKTFGVKVTRLYSSAYLSYVYFQERGKIVDVYRFWKSNRTLLRYACEAYQGGKFEVFKRGTFTGYEYDIVSAYPFEIARLVDISKALVIHQKKYRNDATYGFLRCHIKADNTKAHPVGIPTKGVNIYPMGEFYHTLTKNEYDYLIKLGFDVTIIDAYWLVVPTVRYPYRETVLELYKMKDYYKTRDIGLYHVSKKMLNGFYGKFLQLTEKKDILKAGAGWNPIYGAVITANTRIKMCELQNADPENTIAIHTDSIITTKKIESSLLSKELGGLTLDIEGAGLMLMCGMYDMGEKTAYRGVGFKAKNWKEVLTKNIVDSVIRFKQLRVISWRQATAWDKLDKTNVFENYPKDIDLNADRKRIWGKKIKAGDLLTGLSDSSPKVHIELQSPY
jgi:hypothetical protein